MEERNASVPTTGFFGLAFFVVTWWEESSSSTDVGGGFIIAGPTTRARFGGGIAGAGITAGGAFITGGGGMSMLLDSFLFFSGGLGELDPRILGGGKTGGGIAMKSESSLPFVGLALVGSCLGGGGSMGFIGAGAGAVNEVSSFCGGGPSPMYPDSESAFSFGLTIFRSFSISFIFPRVLSCLASALSRASFASAKSFCTKNASSSLPASRMESLFWISCTFFSAGKRLLSRSSVLRFQSLLHFSISDCSDSSSPIISSVSSFVRSKKSSTSSSCIYSLCAFDLGMFAFSG
mmetsp:Transcript_35732/g.86471  ORF Transcript_35732/g.86471 Transcript_35732/m.86471 type:complete len:291 (-) Transcript_35732:844-1716(-)